MLKRIFAILVFLFFSINYSWAYNWQINDFDVQVDVQPDRTVEVTEKILANFEVEKHGIIRFIPISRGFNLLGNGDLGFELLSVTDSSGRDLEYKKNYRGNYIFLKIGNPNKVILGNYTYIIKYKIRSVIKTFQESDELYWNITGNDWDAPINKAKAIFKLPKDAPLNSMQIKGFVGAYGSTSEKCIAKILDARTFYFEAVNLNSREGLSGAVRFPTGIIQKENPFLNIIYFLLNNWFIFIPFITFIFLFYKWFTYGRDPKKRGTIIPMYEPPKIDNRNWLSPTEVGILIDEKLDPRDISAAVINLAVKGFLKIKEIDFYLNKGYEFIKLKEIEDSPLITEFEKEIFKKIFGTKEKVLLSSLKYNFAEDLAKLKNKAYENMVKNNLFQTNPEKIRANYKIIGIFILFCSFFLFPLSYLFFLTLIISGIEFIIASPFMPKKTSKGVKALEEILGFEEYIKKAEKYHIEWEVKENIFEKYLPYAMVLKLEREWAKRFENIYKESPSWYEGSSIGSFNTYNFTNTLSQSSALMAETFAATYRTSGSSGSGFSSGGGFSGGGSGGGGGSSW
ncbi:MAG: DUF2207 domain-containing protein [Armatimonadetes bacterium]|nr:DUF2207 domain-containing protein [Armatimonadota bacterium]